MNYILSIIILLSATYSHGLFHCFSKAKEHVKLKEKHTESDGFLSTGINAPIPILLHLKNSSQDPERIFSRAVMPVDFQKTAEWHLEIKKDQNGCLEIGNFLVCSPSQRDGLYQYTWHLIPKRKGVAFVRATYTKKTSGNTPYIQDLWVTVE